jgi:hypothetical protein
MLCIAWRAVAFRDPSVDTPEALRAWTRGAHWKGQLARMSGM